MIKKVWFENSKGDKLCGIVSNPTGSKTKPIVIICHGYDSNKDRSTYIKLSNALNKKKVSTLRFSFYGHGESEGKISKFTVREAVDDILCAIKFLRKKYYKKIGLLGNSFGGVAAVLAAVETSNLFVLALRSVGIDHDSRKRPLIKKDFKNKVWIAAGKKVRVPILIVHGEKDEDVELWQATELAKAIKSSRLEIIKGADHRYTNPKDFKKAMKLVVDFIVAQTE